MQNQCLRATWSRKIKSCNNFIYTTIAYEYQTARKFEPVIASAFPVACWNAAEIRLQRGGGVSSPS